MLFSELMLGLFLILLFFFLLKSLEVRTEIDMAGWSGETLKRWGVSWARGVRVVIVWITLHMSGMLILGDFTLHPNVVLSGSAVALLSAAFALKNSSLKLSSKSLGGKEQRSCHSDGRANWTKLAGRAAAAANERGPGQAAGGLILLLLGPHVELSLQLVLLLLLLVVVLLLLVKHAAED
jgi:hypothetical protein